MNTDAIDHLVKGLQHFAVFHKLTNINALDNYGYRELMQIVELRQILPSIEKVPGRSGVDAVAPEQGYANIEHTGAHSITNIGPPHHIIHILPSPHPREPIIFSAYSQPPSQENPRRTLRTPTLPP